jgi:PTS system IIC component
MALILQANGFVPGEVWGYAGGSTGAFTYIFTKSIYFGVGVTVMLLGVRMLISEIVPAFKGIADKVVPGAIPALDCHVIFNYAPNALILGFLVAMVTSTITILLTAGQFPTVIIPLTFTCFFEIGTAAIIGNSTGGVRGAVVGAAVSGIIMVFLVGFGSYFFGHTINNWILVYAGQDFSILGIITGLIARLIG